MSNFSKFFNRIYELRNSSIKNRKVFLTGFFNAAGRNAPIYLSDDTLKSYCNGNRDLSVELTKQFPNPSLTNGETEYLMNSLNKNRIMDFFDTFEIDHEEKQNYELLCRAIAMQFENFMKYGDIAGESNNVKELYKYLLDLELPKGIDNNEDAIYSAKTMFFNALKEFAKVDKNKSLIDSRAQLDNVFQNFFNSFKAFEKRCDHKGLAIYQDVRNELIYKNERLSKYIKMASEPGSLPLPLQKGASIIVYDHVDYHDIKASVMLDEDSILGYNNTIQAIEGTGIADGKQYVFFTEQYAFYLENDKKNLLPGLFDAITALTKFWNRVENSLANSERLKKLNQKIQKQLPECRKNGFAYYYDGTYYPQTKQIKYDVMIEDLVFDENGYTVYTEDIPIPFSENPVLKEGSFEDMFVAYLNRILNSVRKANGFLSTECLLITEDNNVRWMVTQSPSRATITRKLRKMANLAYDNHATTFFWASMHVGCELEQNDRHYLDSMPREKYNVTPFVCVYAGQHDSILSFCISVEDLLKKPEIDIKITNDPFMVFLDPIWFAIRKSHNERD